MPFVDIDTCFMTNSGELPVPCSREVQCSRKEKDRIFAVGHGFGEMIDHKHPCSSTAGPTERKNQKK